MVQFACKFHIKCKRTSRGWMYRLLTIASMRLLLATLIASSRHEMYKLLTITVPTPLRSCTRKTCMRTIVWTDFNNHGNKKDRSADMIQKTLYCATLSRVKPHCCWSIAVSQQNDLSVKAFILGWDVCPWLSYHQHNVVWVLTRQLQGRIYSWGVRSTCFCWVWNCYSFCSDENKQTLRDFVLKIIIKVYWEHQCLPISSLEWYTSWCGFVN